MTTNRWTCTTTARPFTRSSTPSRGAKTLWSSYEPRGSSICSKINKNSTPKNHSSIKTNHSTRARKLPTSTTKVPTICRETITMISKNQTRKTPISKRRFIKKTSLKINLKPKSILFSKGSIKKPKVRCFTTIRSINRKKVSLK